MTITLKVNMMTRQMNTFSSSILWALSVDILHSCNSGPSKFNFMGSLFELCSGLWNTHLHTKDDTCNPILMGFFMAAHGWRSKKTPFPKICLTYPTMMKVGRVIHYLGKIWKIYKSHDTPIEFCWYQYFLTGNQQLMLYQEIQI